jgi:hypothetical protein
MKYIAQNCNFNVDREYDNECIHYIIHENNSCDNDIVFDVPFSSVNKVTKSYINMVAERLIAARQWSQLELDGLYR